MNSPILVNSDGLFNGVCWSALMSESSLEQIKKTLDEEDKGREEGKKVKPSEEKLRAAQREILDLLDRLPRQKFDDIEFGNGIQISGFVSREDTTGEVMLLVPTLVGNFLTSLEAHLTSEQQWDEDPEMWGLEIVRSLAGQQRVLKKMVEKAWEAWGKVSQPQCDTYHRCLKYGELVPTDRPGYYAYKGQLRHEVQIPTPQMIDEKALKASKRLADLFSSGQVSIRSNCALDNLRQSSAFAVYSNGPSGEGYLDGRSNFVDGIGGARLFESAKSAETTIRSRQIHAVVVALDVQVTGMAPGHSAAEFERLGEVISDLNRRKLMDLVAKVRGEDIAELKEKIALREAELDSGEDDTEKRGKFLM